jgi:hypothetical protein
MTHADPETPSTAAADPADADSGTAFLAEHRATRVESYRTYCLPPDARRDGDAKPERRHLVVTETSSKRPGSAIYGSSVGDNPLGIDIEGVRIAERPGRGGGNGLLRATTFYPALLSYVYADDLFDQRGTVNALERVRIQRAVHRALGIGTGVHAEQTKYDKSWRGELVMLDGSMADRHNVDFGIVVTSHVVSHGHQVQVIVPLLKSDAEYDDPEDDVPTTGTWVQLLGRRVERGVWATPLMVTVHESAEPLARVGICVDRPEIERIEAVLVRRFDLLAIA